MFELVNIKYSVLGDAAELFGLPLQFVLCFCFFPRHTPEDSESLELSLSPKASQTSKKLASEQAKKPNS
jgi:hypothetical protein